MDLFELFNAQEFDEQRSFYRKEKQFMDSIRPELNEEFMTEEERREEEESKVRNWEAIQKRIAQQQREMRYIFDVFLYMRFRRMCSRAIALAEECNFDIRVSFHRNDRGSITLRADRLLFQRDLLDAQFTMAKLFSTADDVWSNLIEQDGETLIEFTFRYEVYRKIRINMNRWGVGH